MNTRSLLEKTGAAPGRIGLAAGVLLVLTLGNVCAASWPFFAFENGARFGPPEKQAAVLKELGYDGIGSAGPNNIPQRLKACDEAGLKLFGLYVGSKVSDQGTWYDPQVVEAIRDLKGRDTVIELNIQGNAKNGDEQAVQVVREIADLAAQSGLRVVLYPHAGFYVARLSDALRIAKKSERDNVGVMFNLCHFLMVEPEADLERTLVEARPYLWRVSICGADQDGKSWNTLIQTLDRGTFDQLRVLKLLKKQGFNGVIGLQCYAIPGDPQENLKRSLEAWQKLNQRLRQEAD